MDFAMYTIYMWYCRERIIMYTAKNILGVILLCAIFFWGFCAKGKDYYARKANGGKYIKNRKKYALYRKTASFCKKTLPVSVMVMFGALVMFIFSTAIFYLVPIEEPIISSDAPETDVSEGALENDDDVSTAEAEDNDDPGVEAASEKIGFTKVCILGLHDFGDTITAADLQRFDILYDEYWEDGADRWRIDLSMEEPTSESEVKCRIQEFDQKKMSRNETLTPKDYRQNAVDRIYMYQNKGNLQTLEQAGISAEGAVEVETNFEDGSYSDMFYDMHIAVNCFCYALAQNPESYDSGTAGDVKYRIGKIMYKPFLNLKQLGRNDRYYSLCCSHVFLKDAFHSYNEMSGYAIETAYYYTVNCKDLVMCMEEDDVANVAAECSDAYTRFLELGISNPDNPTFINYKEDAKEAYDYVKSLGE